MITSHVLKKVSGRESLNQANCPLDTFNLLPPGLLLNKLSLTCLSSDIGEEIWSFTIERTKNCVLPPADARSPVKCEKTNGLLFCCVLIFLLLLFSFLYSSLVSLFLLFVLFASCFSFFFCLLFCLICYEHLLALLASKTLLRQ